MEQLKKITTEEISPTLHTGREDSPDLGTEGMQQLFDAHPNLNTSKQNENTDIQNRNNELFKGHMENTENVHAVTKVQVGLGSVDDTSDMQKPVSIAQGEALNQKADKAYTYTKSEIDVELASKADIAETASIIYVDNKDLQTLESAKTYTDEKVIDIGAGDMAQAVYDPWERKANVFEHIENAEIHTKALTENKTIYVSPSGSDESGDGSEDNPYRQINKALSHLPKNLGGFKIKIHIAQGEYNGFRLSDFYGGSIWVEFVGNVTITSWITTKNCNAQIHAPTKLTINVIGNGILVDEASDLCITNESNITINTVYDYSGIRAENGSKIHSGILGSTTGTITVNNAYYAIDARYGGEIQLSHKFAGTGNHYGLCAIGGILHVDSYSMSAVVPIYEMMGGKVCGGNQIRKFKPVFINEPDITLTGDCYYVKNGNVVSVYGNMLVATKTTSSPPEKLTAWRGLPIVVTTPMSGTQTIGSINAFPNIYTYCVFTGVDIDLHIVDNNTHICRPLAIKDLQVGTAISISGFYFVEG